METATFGLRFRLGILRKNTPLLARASKLDVLKDLERCPFGTGIVFFCVPALCMVLWCFCSQTRSLSSKHVTVMI